ncbi:MAG: hypothetical protein FXF54_09495 [Kosmotoga sp.]|nr:MAG: hypothetical protein FXF54_09495 [Kosmotoga sp.]
MFAVNKNKIFLIVLFILISTYSIFGQNVGNIYKSNRFTKPETYEKIKTKFSIKNYVKVAENENIELLIDPETTSLRVMDKRTNYVWGDVLENENAYLKLNDSWKAISKSVLMIEYYNERGIMAVKGSAEKSTEKSFIEIPNGITFNINFKDIGISIDFSILLEDNALTFKLNSTDISEEKEFLLGSVVFAPFFGSTVEDEIDGYIFVPDGPGALIRFSSVAHYTNWFEKRVYGKDYSIENLTVPNDLRASRPNDFLREEPTVLMPVYGIVHGVKQNGMFGVVDSGEEYASIVAYPSGVLTDYNRAGVKFLYRQKYLQPTSRSGAGVQIVQKDKNNFNAELKLFFLVNNSADYIGMAKFYRTEFSEKLFGELEDNRDHENAHMQLALTIIASDIEKKLIGYNTKSITNVEEMESIIKALMENGVDNLKIFIEGWQEDGIHGNRISRLSFEDEIGGKIPLQNLAEGNTHNVYELCLVDNVTKVNARQININREVGINLSQSSIFEERDNQDLWLNRFYYTNIKLSSKYIKEKSKKLADLGFSYIAIKEYGSKLYGDMRFNNEFPRNEALLMVEETLNYVKEKGLNIYFFSPNSYAWKYSRGIIETPMNNSQYLFETDTVPFLQIVLSGKIEYYTPYINNSFFSKTNILKAIEYGAYPSFIITWVDNYVIKETPLWDYPSTKFEDWEQEILKIYQEMSEALNPVLDSKIIDRTVLEPGIVKVDYENGRSVMVNYTQNSFIYGDIFLQPLSYEGFKNKDLDFGDGEL